MKALFEDSGVTFDLFKIADSVLTWFKNIPDIYKHTQRL